MTDMTPEPQVVSADAWAAAHTGLLAEEKALTRAHDCLDLLRSYLANLFAASASQAPP